MSKTTAFLLSFLIYSLIILIFVLLADIFIKNKKTISYGNSNVNILFVENVNDEKKVKQDLIKEPPKKTNEIKKEENNIIKEELKEEKINTNDLFNDLVVKKSDLKKPTPVKEDSLKQQDIERLLNLKKQLSSNKTSSSKKVESNNTSAKVSGIYDVYFGKVNAYLNNVWSLVVNNAKGIDEKEYFEISFSISKNGIIKISDDYFSENSVLRKKAKIFVNTVNNENKNLGIPPEQKEYNGILRLSIMLNIKEIK